MHGVHVVVDDVPVRAAPLRVSKEGIVFFAGKTLWQGQRRDRCTDSVTQPGIDDLPMHFDRVGVHRAPTNQIALRFSRNIGDSAIAPNFHAMIGAGQPVTIVSGKRQRRAAMGTPIVLKVVVATAVTPQNQIPVPPANSKGPASDTMGRANAIPFVADPRVEYFLGRFIDAISGRLLRHLSTYGLTAELCHYELKIMLAPGLTLWRIEAHLVQRGHDTGKIVDALLENILQGISQLLFVRA